MADKVLSDQDIDKKYSSNIYIQDYSGKPTIEGVQIIPLKNMVGEDGDFAEVVRINDAGEIEQIPGLKVKQINRSSLHGNAIKAFHLHYRQDEIWHLIPSSKALIGLWDLREGSPTKGQTMRLTLGGGTAKLLYIPRGVAHGLRNLLDTPAELMYLVSELFNLEDPDERRLKWDSLGADFWESARD